MSTKYVHVYKICTCFVKCACLLTMYMFYKMYMSIKYVYVL